MSAEMTIPKTKPIKTHREFGKTYHLYDRGYGLELWLMDKARSTAYFFEYVSCPEHMESAVFQCEVEDACERALFLR